MLSDTTYKEPVQPGIVYKIPYLEGPMSDNHAIEYTESLSLFTYWVYFFIFMLIFLSTVPNNLMASEIKIRHNQITLNANLQLADEKKISEGVVLIIHGGLAHNKMETIAYLQNLLHQQTYSSLAINLSLGVNDRHGMYDCSIPHNHRHSDTVNEINAWIDWLKQQQVSNIILLGHSVGAAQTALYAASQKNDRVKAVILLAATTNDNGGAGYENRYNQKLAPLLTKARSLIFEGKGDNLISHVNIFSCRDTTVTASTLISYYGDNKNLDTPYLLEKIQSPTLLIIAGSDNIVINLGSKVTHLKHKKNLVIRTIDGSDHFFRDLNSDDAVELMAEFISEREIKI